MDTIAMPPVMKTTIASSNKLPQFKTPGVILLIIFCIIYPGIEMDAKKDARGNPGLFNIKALANPKGKPHWMKGPLNVDIQSMTMTSDSTGRNQILIKYALFGTKHKLIDPIPIEKLIKE